MKATSNLDDLLHFRPDFQAALGGISRSTIIRMENSGAIPAPDAFVGRRPAWLGSTIKLAVSRFVATGESGRPVCDVPRCGGRKKKVESVALASGG